MGKLQTAQKKGMRHLVKLVKIEAKEFQLREKLRIEEQKRKLVHFKMRFGR